MMITGAKKGCVVLLNSIGYFSTSAKLSPRIDASTINQNSPNMIPTRRCSHQRFLQLTVEPSQCIRRERLTKMTVVAIIISVFNRER